MYSIDTYGKTEVTLGGSQIAILAVLITAAVFFNVIGICSYFNYIPLGQGYASFCQGIMWATLISGAIAGLVKLCYKIDPHKAN